MTNISNSLLFGPRKSSIVPDLEIESIPAWTPHVFDGTDVVAVYSPRGGVGKSTTAFNLAVHLADRTIKKDKSQRPAKVLLLDGDFYYGNLGARIGVPSEEFFVNFVEVVNFKGAAKLVQDIRSGKELDPMKGFVAQYSKKPNLHVMTSLMPERQLTFQECKDALTVAREYYDAIVIDCGTEIQAPHQKAWLEEASSILLLSEFELDSLHNTAKCHGYLKGIGKAYITALIIGAKKNTLIKNNSKSKAFDIAKAALPNFNEHDIMFLAADMQALYNATKAGTPLVWSNKEYARDIEIIANQLVT